VTNPGKLTVYYQVDSLGLAGKTHPQFTFLWLNANQPKGESTTLPAQGVRITLDGSGAPVVWEVLADQSGLALIFVSRALEELAKQEHGPPLQGRRFAIEQSLERAPGVVVARVIDDGPMPMGPILYLRERTHEVATLICRCMPSQADKLTETGTYRLAPLSEAPVEKMQQARQGLERRAAFWPGESSGPAGLEKALRLPQSF
jgi:hypothetical protein